MMVRGRAKEKAMTETRFGRAALVGWFFVLATVATAGGLFAAPPTGAPTKAIDEAIAAGEFTSALGSAATLDPAAREAAFSAIAAAQARSGATQAAAATVAGMRDDRLRSRTLELLSYQVAPADDAAQRPIVGAAGGGVQPDFETLIELITNTIRQQDWVDNGGTVGHVKPHDGGVFVDATGAVKPIVNAAELARLAGMRREAARIAPPGGARKTSSLRKISLTRLERELQLRAALGRPVEEELQTLAGLERITHVFVYPESGDVVLAGPAGDWYLGRENRLLSVSSDRPVVLLADLLTLMRREFEQGGPFGCSIEPTVEGLRRVQAFVEASKGKPLAPGGLAKWNDQLRDSLGRQNVRVYGIDPQSRAARILVEADYRMKLVGIEREEGTLHVPSYFQIVRDSGREPPSMGLLRWWFTVNYDALLTSPQRDVYELRGQGVRLSSEDEFLSAQGQRVSTGVADARNRQFSDNFTEHFAEIAQKYPIYADLRNVFDLAVVCAVLKNEGLCERIGWHRLGFSDPRFVGTERGFAPTSVESVANGTTLSKSRVMSVISGGVSVDVSPVAHRSAIAVDDRGRLAKERQSAAPKTLPTHGWWWD
jgi:hypothetical protein